MKEKIILVGGSAGSYKTVCHLLCSIPRGLNIPVVLVLHRLQNVNSGFAEALNCNCPVRPVVEPYDKEKISSNGIYLAPANYHLLFENEQFFSLSVDEEVQYSRPSIDMTFFSAARIFGKRATAIILSGANRDGAEGAAAIRKWGGRVIVHDPDDCEVTTMPTETMSRVSDCEVMSLEKIVAFFRE